MQNDRVENKQDDQQRGDVANDLDVDHCDLRNEPVGREASDTDQCPQDGQKRNTDDHQKEGVLDPDEERRSHGR